MSRRQINFDVDERVYEALRARGAQLGYKPVAYAKMLFEAAYAVRVGVSIDPDVHQRILLAIVLHGARMDTAVIAEAVGLHESTVMQILVAWQTETMAQREAAE